MCLTLKIVITLVCVVELGYLAHIVKQNKNAIKKRFHIIATYTLVTCILFATGICLWTSPLAYIAGTTRKERVSIAFTEDSAMLALFELSLVEMLFAMTWQSLKGWKDYEVITAKLSHDPTRMKMELDEA